MQRGFENLHISEQAAVIALRHSEMFSPGKRNDILRELSLLENPDAEAEPVTLNPLGSKLGYKSGSRQRVWHEQRLCCPSDPH